MIDADATRWTPGERDGLPLLVLLHGYGADEHDLFGLLPHLPENTAIASVAAPLVPPWPMPGRSWYPIDGLNGRDPAAVTAAAQALLDWLAVAARSASTVALLGFSQGAAVALQALRLDAAHTLRADDGAAPAGTVEGAPRIDAVVALSGYAANGELPGDEALRDRRPPVFWGRGTHDDVIAAHLVDQTAQWLPDHSELTGRVYPGLTHSISMDELHDVRIFLEKWRDGPTRSTSTPPV